MTTSLATKAEGAVAFSAESEAGLLRSTFELAETTLLHEVSAELIAEEDCGVLYQKLVDAAGAIMRSDFSALQVLQHGVGRVELKLLAARGFSEEAREYWGTVDSDSSCICGTALRQGGRVISGDLVNDRIASDADLAMYLKVGIRAGQSTPLVTRRGRLVGALSTHWSCPHMPTEQQLRLFDILARQAADLLERNQTDAELREREAWLAGQKEAMQAALDGAPLHVSLGVLVRTVTAQLDDGVRAAFYLADSTGKELHHIVGMGDEHAHVVDGFRIDPGSLARGLAKATDETVVTRDVDDDPRWLPWRWLAERLGYRGCWSFPINTAAGSFVGTFALFWPQPRDATPRHLNLVGRLTQTAAIIISRDIEARERRRIEQALRDADRRKDEFLAMLAHELRNPIAAIRNASYQLLRGADAAGAERCNALIERQSALLAGLVDDLLDVSRITRGLIALHREPCDFPDIVHSAVTSLRPNIDEKQHELELTMPARAVTITGDPARIEQVVLNLVGNAIKYTDPGGRIGVQVAIDGDTATLRVRDNGIGMSGEMLERVFDLFSQAERGLARSQGGLGVGLTIVRRLVELHGGTVDARSEGPGLGSEFLVRLPLAPAARTVVAPPSPHGEHPVHAMRILVVDDRIDCADSMADVLRMHGHQVQTAHDGASALEQAGLLRPHVVLLDLGLPDIDGFEVARRLRQDPGHAAVRLIAISGYGQPGDVQRAREAGFDRHFIKPVAVTDLIETLQADATA
ncbi:ATP-binding protein [Lysobacter sp.]|uniref:hybrid sensor histidine kinase/response regulator n=1 Tax=Lysobacter sp. TaxID=72226 RepID=UPI002D2AE20A|nr:ATP-binding protein [Lysobacter sp.]HZX77988.1 ATP-binding protein [Lysobacter sp.]